jgi:4-amino-4-deoxy-L-arabinose transferase-like glycosyltransferase
MLNRKLNLSPKGQPAEPRAFTQFRDLIDNQPFQVIGMLLILGVLFSVIVMASHPPSLRSGETDSWWIIALNLKHGHGYSLCLRQYFPFCGRSNPVTAMREPVPVFLFAMAAWLGEESLWTAAVVEVIIYLAIILSIYFLTRAWADTRSAVIASFLWAIYLPALELIPQVSGDLFAALCVSLGILFTLRARKSQRTLDWLIAGICLGFAVLSRSATLVIAAVVVGGQIFDGLRLRCQPKNILKPALLVSSLIVLSMMPWLMRNKVALGRPILGSSLTGYNLYRHNYMISENQYLRYVGPEEGAQVIANLISQRSDLHGNENEAQMDLIYRNEALQIIKSHPKEYLLVSAYRVLPLWFDWKIAEAYGHPTNRYGYTVMLLQVSLLILAVLGLRKNLSRTWPLWGSILAISAVYMAVDARLLYVMPVMPLVISSSAVGCTKLLTKVLKEHKVFL